MIMPNRFNLNPLIESPRPLATFGGSLVTRQARIVFITTLVSSAFYRNRNNTCLFSG